MTTKEIFEKILKTCAEVCNVEEGEIIDGSRKEDVVTARALLVFWCMEAGLSVESLLRCINKTNANSINSIRVKIEKMWVERFAFHLLCREVGKRLLNHMHSIGDEFDIEKPLNRLARTTGKY